MVADERQIRMMKFRKRDMFIKSVNIGFSKFIIISLLESNIGRRPLLTFFATPIQLITPS